MNGRDHTNFLRSVSPSGTGSCVVPSSFFATTRLDLANASWITITTKMLRESFTGLDIGTVIQDNHQGDPNHKAQTDKNFPCNSVLTSTGCCRFHSWASFAFWGFEKLTCTCPEIPTCDYGIQGLRRNWFWADDGRAGSNPKARIDDQPEQSVGWLRRGNRRQFTQCPFSSTEI